MDFQFLGNAFEPDMRDLGVVVFPFVYNVIRFESVKEDVIV